MKNINLYFIATLVLLSNPAGAQSTQQQAQQIMDEVEMAPEPKSEKSILRMVLTDAKGRTRTRSLQLLTISGERQRSRLSFTAPADVRGTGLLTVEGSQGDDNQWLYLPALGKTRRIAGSSKSDSFLGTEFTFEDLQDSKTTEWHYNLLGEEPQGGRPCWIIESLPLPAYQGTYTKRLVWIDKEALTAVRVEFFQADSLLKVLNMKGLTKEGPYWTVTEMIMDNKQNGKSTQIVVESQIFDQTLSQDIFSVQALESGRIP
jgi:hypothetical protein